MRIRPRLRNTGISLRGVFDLYMPPPWEGQGIGAVIKRHMVLVHDRCLAQGHFQQMLADKDAFKSVLKGHPGVCTCVCVCVATPEEC